MAKARKREKTVVPRAQTGADLRAWRRAVGLHVREIADLIGVSVRSVIRAEHSDRPSAKVLQGMQRLQDRLLEGRLDLRPVMRRRYSRRREAKK